MRLSRAAVLVPSLILLSTLARADAPSSTLMAGAFGAGALSAEVIVEFVPTGGNFNLRQGTGELRVTLRNRSALVPFSRPPLGNPVATAVLFNVPQGASLALLSATMPAGSLVMRSGGSSGRGSCTVDCLGGACDVTAFYQLESDVSGGAYGTFAHAISTSQGLRGGVVGPSALTRSGPLGDVFSPLVFGGDIVFVLRARGLGRDLDCAADLMALCAARPYGSAPGRIAVRFEGLGASGGSSTRIASPCGMTPTVPSTWGDLKSRYR
jgi:hypothetical protein